MAGKLTYEEETILAALLTALAEKQSKVRRKVYTFNFANAIREHDDGRLEIANSSGNAILFAAGTWYSEVEGVPVESSETPAFETHKTSVWSQSGFTLTLKNGDTHVDANAMVVLNGTLIFWLVDGGKQTKVSEYADNEYVRVTIPTREPKPFIDYKDRGPRTKVTTGKCKNCGTHITKGHWGKREYCSGKCRTAYTRKRKRGEIHDQYSGYRK